jgi:DNA-directed RNA polymerase specialized sigma24 family protein
VDDDVAGTDRLTWARETIAHLDRLPHDQLQALRLVYRDGLLLSEAAARLNVSLTELARRVSAGLQSMGQRPHSAIG